MQFGKRFTRVSLLLALLVASLPASAYRGGRACSSPECKSIVDAISGGNSSVFLVEVIVFVFVILYLVVKIHERWFK
jgi:hypothetical protein